MPRGLKGLAGFDDGKHCLKKRDKVAPQDGVTLGRCDAGLGGWGIGHDDPLMMWSGLEWVADPASIHPASTDPAPMPEEVGDVKSVR
jgi:hypothetical protein